MTEHLDTTKAGDDQRSALHPRMSWYCDNCAADAADDGWMRYRAQDKWGKPGTHCNTTLVEVDSLALEGWIIIDAVGEENVYFRRAGGERCYCKLAGCELSYGDMTYTDACFVLGLPTNRSYCALADMAKARLDGLAEGAPGVLRAACRKLIDAVTKDTTLVEVDAVALDCGVDE